LALTPSNTHLITASSDKTIRIWELETLTPIKFFNVGKHITDLLVTNDVLLVCCMDSKTRVYLKANNVFMDVPVLVDGGTLAKDCVSCGSFSLSGRKFLTGGDDGIVYLYSILDVNGLEPKLIRIFDMHTASIKDVQFNHDGLKFATGCRHGLLILYTYHPTTDSYTTIKTTIQIGTEDDKTMLEIVSLTFNCDGTRLLVVTSDCILRTYCTKTLELDFVLKGHSDSIMFIDVHPMSPRFALTGGEDGKIFIWDLLKGVSIFTDLIDENTASGVYNPTGNGFTIGDKSGMLHFYGTGTLEEIPSQQFHLKDFQRVREDVMGRLIDENGMGAHLVEDGELCSMNRVPYPISQVHRETKNIDFKSGYLVNRNQFYIEMAQEFEDNYGWEIKRIPLDKKALFKRRRLIDVQEREVRTITAQEVQDLFAGVPVPVSSGDEYSGTNASEPEEEDALRAVRASRPFRNHHIPISDFLDDGPVSARIASRARNHYSDDEGDIDEDLLENSNSLDINDDFVDSIMENGFLFLTRHQAF
jgi:hypothetical protein